MTTAREQAIWEEIAALVRDPAVNRAIGELGIIQGVHQDGNRLSVRLRPCTPECWPLAMAGIVRSIRIYAEKRGWEAVVEVEPRMLIPPERMHALAQSISNDPKLLRDLWQRSYTATLRQLTAALQMHGLIGPEIVALQVDALPGFVASRVVDGQLVEIYRHWRVQLGLPTAGPLLLDATGQPITDLRHWERRARLAEIALRTSATICRDTADAYRMPVNGASDGS